MRDSKSKETIKALFEHINEDFNIEVILSQFIESGLIEPSQLYIKPLGSFKRGFKKDLGSLDILDGNGDDKPVLFVGINREGLYDMLPEGLFHTTIKKTSFINTEESVKELKIHQEEEKSARKFFLPIEQEFYRNKIFIEQKEQSVAAGFTDSMLIEMFSQFWDLPNLPEELKINLLYLVPLASVFVGNMELTQKVYELVLNEPVKIEKMTSGSQFIGNQIGLDDAILGDSFILDTTLNDGLPLLKISIGPLNNSGNLMQYLNGGNFKVLLDTLEDFFIPLDSHVEIEIIPKREENHFTLSEEKQIGILSYSTHI